MGLEIRELPFDKRYLIYSDGRVFSTSTSRFISCKGDKNGYLRCNISGKTYKIHRLIALTFLGNPPHDKNQVNHKNGIKSDNRIENLEWVSNKENINHSFDIGIRERKKIDTRKILSDLTETEIMSLVIEYINGDTTRDLAKKYNLKARSLYHFEESLKFISPEIWEYLNKKYEDRRRQSSMAASERFKKLNQDKTKVTGENNGRSKLNSTQVMEIFKSTDNFSLLSRRYKIARDIIRKIKLGILWSSVTGKKYEKPV